MAKCQANPWATCRALQNKYHWDNPKTERCIKDIKKQCPKWKLTNSKNVK